MHNNENTASELSVTEIALFREQLKRQHEQFEERDDEQPQTYLVKLGRVPIRLDAIEFRLLSFLAATPYRAYSRRRIADAVNTELQPVVEEQVDGHVTTLRAKLGFFRDYVQTVPYIGYRFKE